jgi:uncharacterized protein (TIGR02246 family)
LLSRRRTILIAALSPATLLPAPASADDLANIRAAIEQWASDFNTGRSEKVCDLFAPDLVADIQGAPERGFEEQCALLNRALADKSKKFTYAPVIHEITILGDVAIVRLDWSLTTTLATRPEPVSSTEVGMDIFRRQKDGSWKIIRFIAYDAQ